MMSVILFLLAEILLIVDLLQTRYISKHPERYYEINKILGKHPTINGVGIYFVICMILVGVAAHLGLWWISLIVAVLEAIVTYRNYKIGIKFN